MSYYVNPAAFSAVFTVPCDAVDKHLRLAGEIQLKVLLYTLRNLSGGIDAQAAATAIGVPLSEAEDALLYWSQAGLLHSNQPQAARQTPAAQPVLRTAKPSRTDVARRGTEDEKIRFLLREAQQKFGRSLKSNEASSLVWLYDDHGMDVSVILLLVQFAASEGRCNISFIEKTALCWLDAGVQTVADAERQIAADAARRAAWGVVQSVFGMERRQPSRRELELSGQWINEWGISRELLKCAYDACVDSKTKLSFPYVGKILEKWHKQGITTPDEVDRAAAKRKEKPKRSSIAAYDLDLFEQMLNADDGDDEED